MLMFNDFFYFVWLWLWIAQWSYRPTFISVLYGI